MTSIKKIFIASTISEAEVYALSFKLIFFALNDGFKRWLIIVLPKKLIIHSIHLHLYEFFYQLINIL